MPEVTSPELQLEAISYERNSAELDIFSEFQKNQSDGLAGITAPSVGTQHKESSSAVQSKITQTLHALFEFRLVRRKTRP